MTYRFDRLPDPEALGEAALVAGLEIAQIVAVWFIALESYKLLDRVRLSFKPREFWAWLQTPEGTFADYMARSQRDGTETD